MDNSSKQLTVVDDDVEVERTIDERSTATVVAYRLKTLASAPTVVHLEEAIPSADNIETLDFHPEHLPNDWTRGDGTVQFEVIVPPNETETVVFGLEATDETPLGRDEPTISHLEPELDDLSESEASGRPTPGDDVDTSDESLSSLLGRHSEPVADGGETAGNAPSDNVLDLPDPNAADEETAENADSDEVLDLPDPNAADEEPAEDADSDEVLDLPDPNAADEEPVDDADSDEVLDLPDPNESTPSVDEAEQSSATPTVEEAEQPPDTDGAAADLGFDDSADDLDLDDDTAGEPAADPDGDSLVGDLLAEIQAGNASEGELDALRSELGVARADEVRVQHVQSRMSDFEAYVDALEGIINSHGTAAEFVDSIERQVTDLEDELGAVRAEVSTVESGLETADDERETLHDEVADLDEMVAGLGDEVADLHDLVEAADERTATLETELRAEMDALRDEQADQFDRLERELETVREELAADFESEVDSLREDVESFNELRRTLMDAFGNGLEVTADDGTTVR